MKKYLFTLIFVLSNALVIAGTVHVFNFMQKKDLKNTINFYNLPNEDSIIFQQRTSMIDFIDLLNKIDCNKGYTLPLVDINNLDSHLEDFQYIVSGIDNCLLEEDQHKKAAFHKILKIETIQLTFFSNYLYSNQRFIVSFNFFPLNIEFNKLDLHRIASTSNNMYTEKLIDYATNTTLISFVYFSPYSIDSFSNDYYLVTSTANTCMKLYETIQL